MEGTLLLRGIRRHNDGRILVLCDKRSDTFDEHRPFGSDRLPGTYVHSPEFASKFLDNPKMPLTLCLSRERHADAHKAE